MSAARASGTDVASSLKRNTFWTLGVRPGRLGGARCRGGIPPHAAPEWGVYPPYEPHRQLDPPMWGVVCLHRQLDPPLVYRPHRVRRSICLSEDPSFVYTAPPRTNLLNIVVAFFV